MNQKSKEALGKGLNTIDECDISNQGSSDEVNSESQGNESQPRATSKFEEKFEI